MAALAALLLAVGLLTPLAGQVRPVYSRGTAGLVHALHKLQTTASAMHTGAHPDDEDTSLIARLARGDRARTAYLSLNRGEGGQNIIGLELFDALGVIRTEELLQARSLDGGDQFFTRAYDFGFTKTMEEAGGKWDEHRILGDMVRAIRLYRPLVVLSRFSGTPADGHGQHQLAGHLTPRAFKAAADPAQFPEQIAAGLRPWQAKKLYVGESFRRNPGNEPTLRLQTGVFDPVLGRTFAEIAMEGRSQHKSQEMGMLERRGPQNSGLRLLEDLTGRTPVGEEHAVFDGIDTRAASLGVLAGLPRGAIARELETLDREAAQSLSKLQVEAPIEIVPHLARALQAIRDAQRALAGVAATPAVRDEAGFLLAIKEREAEDALVRAAGVAVDVLAEREIAAPGETVRVNVNTFVPDGYPVVVGEPELVAPAGWTVDARNMAENDASDNPFARFFRETPTASRAFGLTVAADAPFTQPYWLAQSREGDVFTWQGVPAALQNLPFAPADVRARVPLTIGGASIVLVEPLEYRYADSVRGEIRRSFEVVPAMTVSFDERLHVVPAAAAATARRVVVRLQSQTLAAASGTVRLTVPAGWKVEPERASFSLGSRGEREAVVFAVTPAPGTANGSYDLTASAESGGRSYASAMRLIDYPHIERHRLYEPARALVRVLDLSVAPVKVGYVMGSGDLVPEAIRRMGLDVSLIDEDLLAAGDLSRFDTIVVGVRASESRPGFVTSNARLLQYVRDGGTLVVQYQQTDYPARKLTPFPAAGNTRVTDEKAPVRILQPAHPAFTTPNAITSADWDGWVQERNLYAFETFDQQYVPLLETQDPGEPMQRGGQLYAQIGRGHYVYTSYAWFRQLPAGVPGAYRLFANLLSLGAKDGKAATP